MKSGYWDVNRGEGRSGLAVVIPGHKKTKGDTYLHLAEFLFSIVVVVMNLN